MATTEIDQIELKKDEEIEIILPNGFTLYVGASGEVEITNFERTTYPDATKRKKYVSLTFDLVKKMKKAEKKELVTA